MAKKRCGPVKTVAAAFLRDLARDVGLPIADPRQRADDLRLIANCIEGKVSWGKPLKHSWDRRNRINRAAWVVEHRPAGTAVSESLKACAKSLAREFGMGGRDDEEKVRDWIAEARKRERKAGWPTLGK